MYVYTAIALRKSNSNFYIHRVAFKSSKHVEVRMTAITLLHVGKFSFWNFPSCVGCPAQNVEEVSSLIYVEQNYTAQIFCDCTLR